MRAITVDEMQFVQGGDTLGIVTGISSGVRLLTVAGALTASFEAGYAVGTYINAATGLSDTVAELASRITFGGNTQNAEGIDE